MNVRPLAHEAERALRQRAGDRLASVDRDRRALTGVARVEVRNPVLAVRRADRLGRTLAFARAPQAATMVIQRARGRSWRTIASGGLSSPQWRTG